MSLSAAETSAASLPEIEETNEVFIETDDMETLPDHGKEIPVKAEAEDNTETDADAETPAAEPEAEKTEEDKSEAELTQEQQEALTFRQLNETFARDPAAYLRHMASMMTPEQRAAAGYREPEVEKPKRLWSAEEDTTPAEKFMGENAVYLQDLPRFAQGMTNAVTTHERYIVEQGATIAALMAQVEALSDAVGFKLPTAKLTIDPKEREAYKTEAKAAAAKLRMVTVSKETATPKTPRNSAGGGAETTTLEAKAGESFMQTFRRVKAMSSQ